MTNLTFNSFTNSFGRKMNDIEIRTFASDSNSQLIEINPINASIPWSYKRESGKPISVFFRASDVDDFNLFMSRIESALSKHNKYMAFIKLRYHNDNFCMCGNQFGFNFIDDYEVRLLFNNVNDRINNTYEVYNMKDEEIVYIQIAFRKVDVKILNDFALDVNSLASKKLSSKEKDTITSTYALPVSTNEKSLGEPLNVYIVDGLVTCIYVTHEKKSFNFLNRINNQADLLHSRHKDNITEFDSSYKFHYIY